MKALSLFSMFGPGSLWTELSMAQKKDGRALVKLGYCCLPLLRRFCLNGFGWCGEIHRYTNFCSWVHGF